MTSTQTPKWKRVAAWIVCGLLAVAFLGSGGSKLAGVPMHVENFARWGYPQWFRVVVGGVEVAAAALLLVPRLATYAAAALVLVMVGAVGTHVMNGEWVENAAPLILGGLSVWAGLMRRPLAGGGVK